MAADHLGLDARRDLRQPITNLVRMPSFASTWQLTPQAPGAVEVVFEGHGDLGGSLRDRDPMYEQAIEIVIREQRGSTSLLQRALGIGYGRASRLIDFMAEDGLVGGFNGSNAREVLVTSEEWAVRRGA